MLLPGREWQEGYRFGFQRQSNDAVSFLVDFKHRSCDSRLGRFISVDPINSKFPFLSTYQFSANKVISMIELEGLEATGYDAYYNSRIREWANGNLTLEQVNAQMDAHTALDIIGVVPVIGEWADGLNGLLYTFEGDMVNAAFSFAAIVPIIGDAGKGIKYSVKIGNGIEAATDLGRTFSKAETAAKFLTDVSLYGEKSANALWDSWKLKRAMEGILAVGEEAHHLIPINLVKDNEVVKTALEAGYDINAKSNGIGLTSVKTGGVHAKHPNYTSQVNDLINKWAKKNPGYTAQQAKEYLTSIEKDLQNQVNTKCKQGQAKVNDIKLD